VCDGGRAGVGAEVGDRPDADELKRAEWSDEIAERRCELVGARAGTAAGSCLFGEPVVRVEEIRRRLDRRQRE